jgi:hypothetical protein
MKKTVLAIALAVATMPLTFAAQTPANPPAAKTTTGATAKTKKHVRKSKKTTAAKPSPAAIKAAPTK